MPARKKDIKQIVRNSVTGTTYSIRKRSAVNPDTGKIKGLWKDEKKKGRK